MITRKEGEVKHRIRFHTPAEFEKLVKAEVPGVDFQVSHSEISHVTVLRWQRRVEGYKVIVSDERDVTDPEALHHLTMRAINEYREKAIQDYGLRAILEREKREAYTEGFRAMVQNLEDYVNRNMVEYETILDGDGNEEELPIGPNWRGRQILAWLKTLEATPEHERKGQ